jgi:cell division protein FtsQ
VDGSGVLLDMPADAAGDPHYSFPVLTGLSADEAAAERSAKMEVYEQFLRELDGSGKHMTDSVSEVDVADPEDVKALITSGSSDILVHFGQEKFLHRYEEFEQHLAEWKAQYPKLASADMRYEGQIVLEMQGDGGPTTIGAGTTETASADTPAPAVTKPAVETKTVASAKPPVLKPVVAKNVAIAAPAPKAAAVNAAVSKPPMPKPAAVNVSAVKLPAPKPDFSTANMPKAAAPKPVVLNDVAAKPVAAPKLVAARVSHPVVKKVVAWKSKPGSGMSAANAKVFAKLAAEHRAELAREHKAAAGNVAKNGRAKSGVTP